MKSEIITLIDYLEKEHGLDKGTIASILEKSIEAVAKKKDDLPPITVSIDTEDGSINMSSTFMIVPDDYEESLRNEDGDIVEDPEIGSHLTVDEAKKRCPDLKDVDLEPGMEVGPIEYEYDQVFGRIDVQTIKQITFQRIREAKRDMILKEYSDKIGDLVSGTVSRMERGSYIVELDRTEAILPRREQVSREHYKVGDRIRAVVSDVKDSEESRSPRVVLSRAVPALVRRLFEIEVPEIYDGIVEIKAVARIAGLRSKIAVLSHDPKVDCVGACVGVRGARVKSIVQEINGEKVDIVRWSDDLETLLKNAVEPTEILEYYCGEGDDAMVVAVVPDDQLEATIGRSGQNVRMISKLIGHPFNVISQTKAAELQAADEDGEEEE